MNKNTKMFIIGVAVGMVAHYAWQNYGQQAVVKPSG